MFDSLASPQMLVMVLCIIIIVAVFAAMLYSIFRHRWQHGRQAHAESLGLELAWASIPLLLIAGMVMPAAATVLAMRDTAAADLSIRITGSQWQWHYEYLDGPARGLGFVSALAGNDTASGPGATFLPQVDRPLVVPAGKKIRLTLSSTDVVHTWSVADFGVRQDAVPGLLRDASFSAPEPGTYRGQCTELCGKEHSHMPIVVQVRSPQDFAQWAANGGKN